MANSAPGGVLFAGELGVGTTHLARLLADEAGQRPECEVIWLAAGASGPSIPFGAFAPFVPQIGGKPGRQPDPFYMLQMLRRALVERAGGRRLVVGVDDAHRLDSRSATLLYQLVAADNAKVILAMRTREGVAEAVRGLWKEGLVRRIEIGPLGRADTLVLAQQMLEAYATEPPLGLTGRHRLPPLLAGELGETLWRISQGNALFLRELIAAGFETGRIVHENELWRGRGELRVGPRLTELLDAPLGRLTGDERAALDLVVFAGVLPLDVLTKLAGMGEISSLQRQGLIRIDHASGEQQARPGHPLIAEVVLGDIHAVKRSELSRDLADTFERENRTCSHLLQIVAWRLEAGTEQGADLLLAASSQAADRQDWHLSRRLASAAVEAGGGTEASIALADAYRSLGRYEEALAALDGTEGDDDQVARVGSLRSFVLSWGLGRYEEAHAALVGAQGRITDPSNRTWLEAVRAGIESFSGRPATTVARARALLETDELSPRAEVAVRSALAVGLAWSGRADEALAVADISASDVGGWPIDTVSVTWLALARATAYRVSGRLDDLEKFGASQYRTGLRLGHWQAVGAAANALGWAAVPRGQLTLAAARFREAAAILEDAGSASSRASALCGLAEALAVLGQADEAEDVLRDAVRQPGAFELRYAVPAALVTAARGDVSRGLAELEEAAVAARATGQVAYELEALTTALRLGSTRVAPRLRELATVVEGPFVQIASAHAQALASDDGADDLDAVAERYASISLNLFAAVCAAQASRAHSRAGRARRAAASSARANSLLTEPGGFRPLGVAVAMAPAELTSREREVALLAMTGLSSQAIASRLSLSVRTVDTHLARVYFKLGITGRSSLAAALRAGPRAVPLESTDAEAS